MDHREALQALVADRVLMIETLMQIEDKNRNLVQFILNPIQRDMAITSTNRDVYLKPAQVGASSFFVADFLLDCLTIPGTVAIIISYDEFITGRLLRKAQNFYNILHMTIPDLPTLSHKSVYEKVFVFRDGSGRATGASSFYIASARSFEYGRGEIIHDLLADEFAYWPPGEATEFLASALQRVPLLPNTKVRIASTPNGEDNDFCEVYRAAKEGKAIGKSVYTAHFYPWYLHPEYSLTAGSLFVLPNDETISSLDSDESSLVRRLNGVSEEELHNKLRWRRYKQAEMLSFRRSGETRTLFGQEYPEDDVSCFLVAGDMVYDTGRVNDMAKQCYPAPVHHLNADIWYPPEPGVKYLVAIDPGQGATSESVATVWQFTDTEYRHCASLGGLYKNDQMAAMSKELAKYYNHAIIAPEDALDLVSHLTDYSDLYYRTDPITGRVSDKIGWQTTKSTKPYMITELARSLSKIITHDNRLVSQCRNIRWVLDRSGTDRAVSVGADDYHDSAAIAIVCRTALPVERGFVGVSGWQGNWGKVRR